MVSRNEGFSSSRRKCSATVQKITVIPVSRPDSTSRIRNFKCLSHFDTLFHILQHAFHSTNKPTATFFPQFRYKLTSKAKSLALWNRSLCAKFSCKKCQRPPYGVNSGTNSRAIEKEGLNRRKITRRVFPLKRFLMNVKVQVIQQIDPMPIHNTLKCILKGPAFIVDHLETFTYNSINLFLEPGNPFNCPVIISTFPSVLVRGLSEGGPFLRQCFNLVNTVH